MSIPETIIPHELAQLLTLAVWAGLCAGVLAIWNVRWLRPIIVIHAAVIGLLSAVLLVWTAGTAFDHSGILGNWLTWPNYPRSWVIIGYVIDSVGFSLLCGVSAVVFLLGWERGDAAADSRRGVFLFLSYQSAVQFVVCGDDLLFVFFGQLLSVTVCLMTVCDATSTVEAVTNARRTFLFRIACDGVILIAVLVGESHPLFGVMFVGGVIGRTCPFPFFSRERFTGMPRDAALVDRQILTPLSVLFLIRCFDDFMPEHFGHSTMLIGGSLMALLAAQTAVARSDRNGLPMLSLSFTGFLIAGIGNVMSLGENGAVLLFLCQAVLLTVAESGISTSRRIATAAWILLGSGLAGQGLILTGIIEEADGNQNPTAWMTLAALGAAHLAVTIAIGRHLRRQAVEHRSSRNGSFLPGTMLIAVLGFIAVLSLQPLSEMADRMLFSLIVLTGLIGMTAGWMTGRPETEDHKRKPGWIADGFRLDRLFVRTCVIPVQFLAVLCRFAEWFILEWLWSVPSLLPRLVKRIEESLETQSLRRSVCAVLLAAALLSAALVLGN